MFKTLEQSSPPHTPKVITEGDAIKDFPGVLFQIDIPHRKIKTKEIKGIIKEEIFKNHLDLMCYIDLQRYMENKLHTGQLENIPNYNDHVSCRL